MLTDNLPRIVAALAGLALLAAAWFLLAPPAIGGGTSIVITSGNSMEPKLHNGDLVIARQRPSYVVGDLVLFHSHLLGRHVLHRIVAVDGDRFVTKGDNNDYRDPERVLARDVQGEAALHLPSAGRPIAWLGEPLHAAAVLFLLVFLSFTGGREVSRRHARPATHPLLPPAQRSSSSPLATDTVAAGARNVLASGFVALGLFAVLALIAWHVPETRAQPVGQAYEHTGVFSYSAQVRPSTVYPQGLVATGDTAFTRLVRRLDVSFAYRFDTTRRQDVRGGIKLEGMISDGSGWSRAIPIDTARPFDGPTARVDGVLDLRRLEAIAAHMRALTGSAASTFEVTVRPEVEVAGYAGEAVVDEVFAPELRFVLDPVSLRPDPSTDLKTMLAPREAGSAVEQRDARIGPGALSLQVSRARILALLGLVIAALATAGSAVLLARRADGTESARIEARHGDRIVAAATVIPEGRWVTDVPDIESLIRLAEHYDRVVLRTSGGACDTYLVDDGLTVYRYRASSGIRLPSPSSSPLPRRA